MPLEHTYYHVQTHCRPTFAYPKMADSDRQLAHLSKSVTHFACISSNKLEHYLNPICQLLRNWPGALAYSHQLLEFKATLIPEPYQRQNVVLPVVLFDPLCRAGQPTLDASKFSPAWRCCVHTRIRCGPPLNHPAVIFLPQHSPRLISLQILTSV